MRKKCIRFLIAGLMTSSLLSAVAVGKKVELEYWTHPAADFLRAAVLQAEMFTASHPDIKINAIPMPVADSSVIVTAVATGEAPDVSYSCLWDYTLFAWSGIVVPLNDFPGFKEVADQLITMDDYTYIDGKVYAMPHWWGGGLHALNIDHFKEAGLNPNAPPKTYSEFIEAGKKLTRDIDGDGEIDRWGVIGLPTTPEWWQQLFAYDPMYWGASNGQYLLTDDLKRMNFNNEYGKAVFEFYRTLVKEKIFPLITIKGNLFGMGMASMVMRFDNQYVLNKDYPDLNYDVFPLVKPDYATWDNIVHIGNTGLSIFTNSEYKDEAWEFIKYATIDIDSQIERVKTNSLWCSRKDYLTNPRFSDALDLYPASRKMIELVYNIGMQGNKTPFYPQLFLILSRQFQDVVFGDKPIDEALAYVEKEWNKFLNEAYEG